jgi:Hypothetical glycosyl hydrolase family 15
VKWWSQAETFHISSYDIVQGANGAFDWRTLAGGKQSFTTHCPVDAEFIARCHVLGVRCFPYVVFYMGPSEARFGPLVSQTYQGVAWVLHPDMYELDQHGNRRVWAFDQYDGVGMVFPKPVELVCPNVLEYQDRMVAWVDYIMTLGADGVFIDVIMKRERCYATHRHIFAEQSDNGTTAQNKSLALLLERVAATVKGHRSDGLVLGNTGDPLNLASSVAEFQRHLDADMIENYICGPDGRTTNYWAAPNPTWRELNEQLQPYLATGKRLLVVSDVGSDPQRERDNAFLCYASARLAGFIWWRGPHSSPIAATLSQVKLGSPSGAMMTDANSGIQYRLFERGVIAVNWDPEEEKVLEIQPPPVSHLFDLYPTVAEIEPHIIDLSAGAHMPVPPSSGRVYLWASSTDYGLNHVVGAP